MYYEDVYNNKHHENRQLESKHPTAVTLPPPLHPTVLPHGAFSMFAIT